MSHQDEVRQIMETLRGPGSTIKSIRTADTYESIIAHASQWLAEESAAGREKGRISSMMPDQAIRYLESRKRDLGQKALDQQRNALQCMMRFATNQLSEKERLPFLASEKRKPSVKPRPGAYTPIQIEMVREAQKEKNAVATAIASHCGLLAYELFTLRPKSEQPPTRKAYHCDRFLHMHGEAYTVVDNAGVCREIVLPTELAEHLERLRLSTPKTITDRGIVYQRHYDIAGGAQWSMSFRQASKRVLGWSRGTVGLRYTYAQERLLTLQLSGLHYRVALDVVAEEMGNHSGSATLRYLR